MTMRLIHGVYIADTARVIGELDLGENVNIWYGVTIRGDVAKITVGRGTNVQDNAVIHCDHGLPNVIGENVTIGHGAIVHGVAVGDGSLIAMGATVLGRAVLGRGCLIAAGAVVPPGMTVADGMVVMGVPGKVMRETTDAEKRYLHDVPRGYIESAKLHHEQPNDPRVKAWGDG